MGFPVVSSSKWITRDHLRGRNEQTDGFCSVLGVELDRPHREDQYFIAKQSLSRAEFL